MPGPYVKGTFWKHKPSHPHTHRDSSHITWLYILLTQHEHKGLRERGLVASWLRSTVMYLIHVLSYINFNFFKPFFNLPIQKLYNKLRSIYFVMQDLPICVNKSATMKCYSWILFFSRITLKYKNYCILTIPICLKKNFQVLKS